jgi:predicted CXXCH cytochrome family protein
LKADKGHAGFEGKSCTDCHDPHVGTNANLLKPSAMPK